jgi:hypothetical protein
MSKISILLAGDKNYKAYVEKGKQTSEALGYPVSVYDLGGLGFGTPFVGRISDVPNAKIPCKPRIILEELKKINDGDYVVWLDADAIIKHRIDEIQADYDIAVTVRAPKAKEHQLPINAGIVFIRKTPAAIEFVNQWMQLAEQGISDQPPLNKLCGVNSKDRDTTVERNGVKIHVYKCEIYNNFYKQGKMINGVNPVEVKIVHYKTKLRHLYPLEKQ